ncbi:phage virion morphogenesis protein [Erwinia persicina]|uniref:phage virion morphogenesis protein n=1 Tax=Erwinia persicina TaxID=55211 RepID=UPI002104015E|nr:phage virion morphogenesis protein [Erwinia persicina]MCQ4106498.1 phage virion morphogenesis protein [Erwinia persicina]UTX15008.1 phage virion morphogenesis protein [Erwinia persicina]
MNPLEPVETRLAALIANLSPAARKQMASGIARKLRASQQRNIKSQKAPDGTPFKPRKAQPLRGRKGRIKREMFAKLRTAKYMKAKGTIDDATVEFAANVQHIALVHHYGLRDRASRQSDIQIKYEPRNLLGMSNVDLIFVEDIIINHLKNIL